MTLIRTYGEDEEIAITFNATEVRRATRSASAFDPTRARPPPPRDRIRRRDAVPPSTLNETRPSRPRSPLSQDPYDEDDGLLPVEGELEEDEEEDITIHFLVSVSKGDGREALEFSCATDGETVEVRNVRYESLGSDDEDDMGSYMSSYPGPNYDELDESVQEEFHKYLEARGVDSGLANYIRRCTAMTRRNTPGGSKTSATSSAPSERAGAGFRPSRRARVVTYLNRARRYITIARHRAWVGIRSASFGSARTARRLLRDVSTPPALVASHATQLVPKI